MDKETMIKFAPWLVVGIAFFMQYNLFVTPAQLEIKHREIIKEVSEVYTTKEQTNDLKNQLSDMQQKIDRIYENLDVEDIMDDLIDDLLCCVSDKGYDYLEKHEYTNYYRRYLRKLSFTEFEEHYDSNIGSEAYLIELGYLTNNNDINNIDKNMDNYVNAIASSFSKIFNSNKVEE